jgi:hypothetical protein
MIRRHDRNAPVARQVAPLRVHTVRLLNGDEELQAAVERARAFERRGSDECQRRVGTYDRLLSCAGRDQPPNVALLDSLVNAPAKEPECGVGSDVDIAQVRPASPKS